MEWKQLSDFIKESELMTFKGFGLVEQDPNVIKNRNIYVGGSDVPTILGINKYKTQYELALEKTGIREKEFISNAYTQFGNKLEPQIRDYINAVNDTRFVVDTFVNEDEKIRSNVDGIDKEQNILLEIKTHGSNPTLKVYEAQMQLYMDQTGCDIGWLALYKRPEDFDLEFDSDRLAIKEIERDDDFIQEIKDSIETFWIRCEFLKDKPKMDDTEFMTIGTDMDKSLVKLNQLAPKIIQMKETLSQFEKEEKELKAELYSKMEENDIKKIDTPLLTVTRVLPTKVNKFDKKNFRKDHPELAEQYTTVGNKKGYIKLQTKGNGK